MTRLIELAMATVICFCIALILWLIKGKMMVPIRTGEDISLKLVIDAENGAPKLEQAAAAALWIKENCAPDAKIVIRVGGLNENGSKAAEIAAKRYKDKIFFENY